MTTPRLYRTRLRFLNLTPRISVAQTAGQSLLLRGWRNCFCAGDADLDLFVVESGAIEILNPSDDNRHIVTHGPGQFAGDIDLLTRRPVIVTCMREGQRNSCACPGPRLREILNKIPRLSEKLMIAAQERRRLLTEAGVLGLKVVGPGKCRDTMLRARVSL